MRKSLFLIPLLVSSAACNQPAPAAEAKLPPSGQASASATAKSSAGETTASANSTSTTAKGFQFRKELGEKNGGTFEFEYSWSAPIAAEPDLVALLDKEREERLAEESASWRETADGCPTEAVTCRNYSFSRGYEVVASLPRFLSLSSGFYSYTGGAHGNYGKGSLVWDRETRRLIEPESLFASPSALGKAVLAAACVKLDKERLRRRGEVVESVGEGDWPNNCPAMDETVLFLGSSNGRTFDRLGAYYGPYVAGAYAEGEYEIDLPVTPAVIAAVKPQYRPYFSVRR